jgi:protein tyrosine/serine phosphatase
VVRAYLSYLQMRPDSIVASVRAIARARGAVLVHCAAGKDRTGVIVALALDAAGFEREAIVADYLATAERIEEIVARLSLSPLYREQLESREVKAHAPYPGTIERVLELIDERYGGSASWLSANGLDEADMQLLRRRLPRPPAE